jgi:hypothetical protein
MRPKRRKPARDLLRRTARRQPQVGSVQHRRPLHSSARTPRRLVRSPGCEPRGRAWSRPSPTPGPPRSIHRARHAIVASWRRRHAAVHGLELHCPLPGRIAVDYKRRFVPPVWRLANSGAAPLFGSFLSLRTADLPEEPHPVEATPLDAPVLSEEFWVGFSTRLLPILTHLQSGPGPNSLRRQGRVPAQRGGATSSGSIAERKPPPQDYERWHEEPRPISIGDPAARQPAQTKPLADQVRTAGRP